MYEFENENQNATENRDEAYHYASAPQSSAPSPRKNNGRKHGKAGRMAQKAGVIALSAVLFGGVASGTFLGINHLAGYSASQSSQAAQNSANGQTASSASSLLKAVSTPSSDGTATGSLDVSDVASAVMPSIVSITNKSVQEVQNYFSMFGYGVPSQEVESESVGSGIIIGKNDTELLIVTNNHVVEGADTLSASFIDNSVYEANLKGTDPDNDLAVIAVPLSSIPDSTMSQIAVAKIGDSDALKVGEQVVAIGNALGYGQSVTTGIVSATDRALSRDESSQDALSGDTTAVQTYIQTDAAINPGNSGGALVNMNGEVVGINSAKLASTEVEGMGYAIPITRVSDIIEKLMNETTRSKVAEDQRASLGISGISVDSSINQAYGIPSGVYVASVTEGSGAAAAGIQRGDVITQFDGKNVTDIQELKDMIEYYTAGETVSVTVKTPAAGGDYTEKTVNVTLGQAQSTDSSTNGQNGNSQNGQNGGNGQQAAPSDDGSQKDMGFLQ
ncbi:MAG: trypsin-like peptidase domain-containing protein [Eubacteriales bacterium]|nr:trypsin-like peptidase domain-containing protein [Eubacteriales bacterium]